MIQLLVKSFSYDYFKFNKKKNQELTSEVYWNEQEI